MIRFYFDNIFICVRDYVSTSKGQTPLCGRTGLCHTNYNIIHHILHETLVANS